MSVKYKLTEFLFRYTVKPMMKKAIKNPDEYFAKQEKKQKSKLPLEKLHKSYDFEEKCTSGTLYYVVKPKNKVANRLVLYFFGGGYTIPGDSGDFEFAQDMANQSQAEVWIVWYPLFPKATGLQIIDAGLNVYSEALKVFNADDIIFFGLSSGASLAQNICLHILENDMRLSMPKRLIMHSPTFRIPPTKEQMKEMEGLDKFDCIIPACYMKEQDQVMQRINLNNVEYMKSPIEYSWKGLPDMYIIYGSYEVLIAELPEAKEKAKMDGVVMKTYIGERMMHAWAAAGFLPEAKEVRRNIYAVIRGDRNDGFLL